MFVHFTRTIRVLWCYFMLGFGLNSLNFVQRGWPNLKRSEKAAVLPIKSEEKLSWGLQFNHTVGTVLVLQYFSCLWQWDENKMYLWTKQPASYSQKHNYSGVKSLTYTKAKRNFAEPHVESSLWVTSDLHSDAHVLGTRVCKSRCWLWAPFCEDQALSIKLV